MQASACNGTWRCRIKKGQLPCKFYILWVTRCHAKLIIVSFADIGYIFRSSISFDRMPLIPAPVIASLAFSHRPEDLAVSILVLVMVDHGRLGSCISARLAAVFQAEEHRAPNPRFPRPCDLCLIGASAGGL